VFHDDFLSLLKKSIICDQLSGVEKFEVVDEGVNSLCVATEHLEDLHFFLEFV
jgi:hypothetical protein